MSKELYKRYRPITLKGVLGQDSALAALQSLIHRNSIPHALLLTGPSGCGKTTVARILKTVLDCGDQDWSEINCADIRGIDGVRDIRDRINLRPLFGSVRIYYIDEAHKLTNDAQNALLKLLEDTPKHVYFILSTTDPHKLIKTIQTRCTEIKLGALGAKDLEKVVKRVVNKEQLAVSQDVVDEIVNASDGSARKALVILDQVGSLEGDDAQLEAITNSTLNKDAAKDLSRLLLQGARWPEIAKVLRAIEKDEPEQIRYMVLGYCRAVMLNSPKQAPRAYIVIDAFSSHFYDSKHAGLAAACWEVVCGE